MFDTPDFEGGVFSKEIDGGRASATISLDAHGLIAVTSTSQRFELLYSECVIDIGGASGKMVFCRNADRSLTIFCEERRFQSFLEAAAAGQLTEQVAAITQLRRSENWQWRFWILAAVVSSVIALAASYYGLIALAKSSVHHVPVSVDIQIGKLAVSSFDGEGAIINDPVIVDAITKMVDRLAKHAEPNELEFQIRVIDSSTVNAMCLPGGQIIVYSGLIKAAQTPEQVAGVLSHEMAHAIKRHGLQRAAESIGIIGALQLLVGDVAGIVGIGVQLAQHATLTSYGRDHEVEADTVGVEMLHAAAIDPLELAAFFELLRKEQGDIPEALSWISTHPQHDARIAAIRGQLGTLGPQDYQPLGIDWDEVQKHLAK